MKEERNAERKNRKEAEHTEMELICFDERKLSFKLSYLKRLIWPSADFVKESLIFISEHFL